MENNQDQQQIVDEIYNTAAHMLVEEKRSSAETREALVAMGLDEQSAATVVFNLTEEIDKQTKSKANKDMLYGALWCVGGIVATASDVGYIFWGAILFGAVQFIQGAVNASS